MQLLSAHPLASTAHTYRFDSRYQTRQYVPVIRRIAGITLACGMFDILHNDARIIRADWTRFLQLGSFTFVYVAR